VASGYRVVLSEGDGSARVARAVADNIYIENNRHGQQIQQQGS
jgi:hypothetical protein